MIVGGVPSTVLLAKGGRGKCLYCGKYENNVSYHESHECERRKILDAELEFSENMKRLDALPRPSIERVKRQMEAASKIRKKMFGI